MANYFKWFHYLRLLRCCLIFSTAIFTIQYSYSEPSGSTELVLFNGKIFQHDNVFAQAVLIKDSLISEIGNNEYVLSKTSNLAKSIDLKGATVIPGLIDSHIHAIRAGLTFGSEVNWIDAKNISIAVSRIKAKAKSIPKNDWIIVAGGWSENQFEEKRKPSQAEIDDVALGHPVYIQHFYDSILLSTVGIKKLQTGLDVKDQTTVDLLSRLEADINGKEGFSGWLTGNARVISDIYNLLPSPSKSQNINGTKLFFKELNSLGITGVIDPGGYNLPLNSYDVVKELASSNNLSIKIRYSICAPRKNLELIDFKDILENKKYITDSDFLKFNGFGENVTWSMYNNDHPTNNDIELLKETLFWAAKNKLTLTFHWNNNDSVHYLLDALEEVNTKYPISTLRWSIAHLNDASKQTLIRMQHLGVGWHLQNYFYYRGRDFIQKRGVQISKRVPLIKTAIALGIKVSAGTDAHRVMSYNPFIALQWLLDGKTVDGLDFGQISERPTREEALDLYTINSAWFTFESNLRGRLEEGYKADLVVLNQDYFVIPIDQISKIKSVLTIVNGQIVYSDTH